MSNEIKGQRITATEYNKSYTRRLTYIILRLCVNVVICFLLTTIAFVEDPSSVFFHLGFFIVLVFGGLACAASVVAIVIGSEETDAFLAGNRPLVNRYSEQIKNYTTLSDWGFVGSLFGMALSLLSLYIGF